MNYVKIGDLYWAKNSIPGEWTWEEATSITSEQFAAFVGKPPKGRKWFLPSEKDFIEAEKLGFRKKLKGMNSWYWTSSPYDLYVARVFYGGYGGTYVYFRYGHGSVRCAGR